MDKKLSQTDLLYNLLKDEKPHSTVEIMEKVYGGSHLGLARAGARVWDIKKRPDKYGQLIIEGWKDKENPSIYWYQIRTVRPVAVFNTQVYSPSYLRMKEKSKQHKLF
jgi:hypothetical protein